jgi:hypothetical protein
VLVQAKTIQWAKETNQNLILLKLDFKKAYDTVSLPFLFRIMAQIGIPDEFTQMFQDASCLVCINGAETNQFPIQRGVRQGCPRAPYLFLFIGEALNIASKQEMELGHLLGIELAHGNCIQLMVQFVDDTNHTLLGTEANLHTITSLLQTFHLATGLKSNWDKLYGYWFSNSRPPDWLQNFPGRWAVEDNVAKMLGIPFGIDPQVHDIDQFLFDKIMKKLNYWSSTRLSLAGRAIVVNMVLSSTLWYFLTLWRGSLSVIRKIHSYFRNFLWSGSYTRKRARVRWYDVCAPKTVGGLNLIDTEKALNALLTKWIIKALGPGKSNRQIALRSRLLWLKPDIRGRWLASIQWTGTHKFVGFQAYRAWNRLLQAWRKFVTKLDFVSPKNEAEVLSTPLWWNTQFYGSNFGFTMIRAASLARKGLRFLRDMWNPLTQTFLTGDEIQRRYVLDPDGMHSYERMVGAVPAAWVNMLTVGVPHPANGE